MPFQINLIYGTQGNTWTHHMDEANAGQQKVLKYDLRCFDEDPSFPRYDAWIEVTFRAGDGTELDRRTHGPQPPFNPIAKDPKQQNSTRWSFCGDALSYALSGTMELKLHKATGKTPNPSDPLLYTDVKKLGHQVGPTAAASGSPTDKRIPKIVKVDTYHVYVVDKFTGIGKHVSWDKDQSPPAVKDQLQTWMALVNILKTDGKTPASRNDPITKEPWAEVHWGTSLPANVSKRSMFVRLCPLAQSKFTAAQRNVATSAGAHGMTAMINKKMHCEVWPERLQTTMSTSKHAFTLAQLIFHEWLHYKVDAEDGAAEVVHGTSGYGALPIGDNTPADPPESDLKMIADNLDKEFELNPQ